MHYRVFGIAMLLVATSAMAGPFGVDMGQSVVSLHGRAKPTKNFYEITVPNPNSEFDSYSAIATPETGVCKVWGTGKDYTDDASGQNVRSAYKAMKQTLDTKYGKAREFDFLHAGALWDKDSEWVMAINKNERSLSSFWDQSEGSKLPEGLKAITLTVEAYRSDVAYLDLTYEFDNFKACQMRMQAKAADGL